LVNKSSTGHNKGRDKDRRSCFCHVAGYSVWSRMACGSRSGGHSRL